ncbi:transglycosylase SLT domain-containing protein [Streptacidiphilus carbonis]|uniref:transglycosylase SLT domain-containing protein n=1 Tax=Streptacidiphilus carbonis TaxID=105422 RepID=UPI0005A8182C|nr:transglycosylase SLT domain-containing protein [Streptacidiphilus carbonis]
MEVTPDTEGFKEKVQAAVDEALAGVRGRARVDLDTAAFDAKLDDAKARLDEFGGDRSEASLHLNSEQLSAAADEAHEKLDELDSRSARPDVALGTDDLDAKLDEARERIQELDAEHARPDVTLNTGEFDAKLDEARARLAALNEDSASPRVYARDAQGRFAGGGSGEGEGGVGRSYLRDSRGRFIGAGGHGEEPAAEPAEERASRFRALLGGVTRRLQGAGDQGGQFLSSAGGGVMSFLGEHALGASLTAGVTALAPGIAGAGMGLGLLGGAGILGLGGIGEAVSAAHQASMNIGMTPQQKAATQFSNQVAVQQAQNQVGQAHMQAAQDAITSAESIESAEMNLASTERNAAEQQVQALQSVRQAQQGVEEANYGLSEAQYNLTQAWETAREQIRQLNDQLADSKLNVQQAQLAIKQAIYQQRLVDQNAYSTLLDRQQASLAVAQAQQQLTDAQDQQTAAQYKANLVNKEGVAGQQTVIQAKQGVTAAQYQQLDAQAQYADAQRQLTLTELNNASQVKQAQMQLSAAQEQAAFQRRMDARTVAIAEQNVSNTIKEQQLQWAATMSTENQAALLFQKDMSRLTPAARAVVEQILSMRTAFHAMAGVAQNAIAPGVSLMLTGLMAGMPKLTQGVGQVGNVISGVFAKVGRSLQSASGAKVLDGLVANGVRFAQIVVPALTGFVGALAKVGSQKGAVDGLANLIGGLAGGLTNVVTAVAPFTSSLSLLGTVLGKALGPVGTLLGGVVGQLAKTLAPLLVQLLPSFRMLVGLLGAQLTQALQEAAPALVQLVTVAVQLLPAVTPLVSIFGSGLAGALRVVSAVLQGLNTFLAANISWVRPLASIVLGIIAAMKIWTIVQGAFNLVMDANPISIVALAIAALVGGVVYAYGHFTWFRQGVQAAFSAISAEALFLWHNVFDPMWHGIEAGASWLYNNGIKLYFEMIRQEFTVLESVALWMWHNVFDPLWHGIVAGASGFVSMFKTIWSSLETTFKTPVNFLINTVYKGGIEALWNKVVGAVGLSSLNLPDITPLAAGGVLPGYAPGRDSVPAVLSPGEGVLVPEAVRAIGPGTVNALNAKYGGGRGSGGGHYSGGGIAGLAGSIWHGVTSAASKAVDMAKITAALATGNTTALSNALTALVGTNAVGNYAKMMLGVPTTLIGHLTKAIVSMFTGSSGGSGGTSTPSTPSGTVAQWFQQAVQLTGVGAGWLPDLETIGHYESGDNPNAINNTDSNAMAGDPSRGVMQTIMSTFQAYHQAGTSSNIFDPVANIAAAINYIKSRYGTVGNVPGIRSLASGGSYVGYDSGGWLMPDSMPVNHLGKPEAVLTPQESAAFVAIVRQLTSQGVGASGLGRGVNVVQNFNGTMWPNPEQQAAMRRDLALALGGA